MTYYMFVNVFYNNKSSKEDCLDFIIACQLVKGVFTELWCPLVQLSILSPVLSDVKVKDGRMEFPVFWASGKLMHCKTSSQYLSSVTENEI